MEKPARIVGNDRIRTFNEKVRNGLEHALNFMLSTNDDSKIQISTFDTFMMPIEAYIGAYRKKSVMIKIHAEKDFVGELYWFFELRTAIVMGSLMRMMTPASFEDKLKAETFDASDQDAFGEVGNQLCGILDRAFRTLTSKNIHLRMDFNKRVYPDESIQISSFANHEEYVVLLSTVTVPTFGTQKLTLLLPRTLYETMLNLEVALDGITQKVVVVHSWDPVRIEKIQAALNSRYVKVVPVERADDVLTAADLPGVAAVALDVKPFQFPLAHQDMIFCKRLVAQRNLMRMPYFLTWDGVNAAGQAELKKIGLLGVNLGSLEKDFVGWTQAVFNKPAAPAK